jgi:hypothetical protein
VRSKILKSLRCGAIIRGLKIKIQWIEERCSLEKEIREISEGGFLPI